MVEYDSNDYEQNNNKQTLYVVHKYEKRSPI